MVRPEHPGADLQQVRVQVPSGDRIARLPGRPGQVFTGGQGERVFWSKHSFVVGQQA